MACIYNERVKKSIVPLAIGLLILGLSLITLSYYGTKLGVHPSFKTEMDLLLTTLFLLTSYRGLSRSRHSYRYSIIADDLIIHRMCGDHNHVIEKVKLSEIQSLRKVKNPTDFLRGFRRTYTENLLKKDYICAYENQSGKRTFYFSPSPCMINKLNLSMKAL